MLIIGDLSGIQDYLFDVANEGGQQSKRLRSRSFFIQLAAECLALRVMKAAGCSNENLLFCGAGKFIIQVISLTDEQRQALLIEQHRMSEWLLVETNGQLRLSLAVGDTGDTPRALYENTMQALQLQKLRAWAMTCTNGSEWQTDSLILKPLDNPCDLCGRRSGVVEEVEDDGQRLVCLRCYDDRQMGKALPRTRWIALSETAQAGAKVFHLPGWRVTLRHDRPLENSEPLIHLTSSEQDSTGRMAAAQRSPRRQAN